MSAILEENGLAWIDGYKPRHHYQRVLADQVLAYAREAEPSALEAPEEGTMTLPTISNWRHFITSRPPPLPTVKPAVRIDFGEREARNQKLGTAGERFVVELEKKRLFDSGHPELAQEVVRASERKNTLPYDVESFTDEGKPLRLEVKTTGGGAHRPFYMSCGEFGFATICQEEYRLARVYRLGRDPRVFFLDSQELGALYREPLQFRFSV